MRIVVEIPDNEVPTTQEVVATYIHFIDGEVCELGNYGVMTLPKGHGDLIDRDTVVSEINKKRVVGRFNTVEVLNNAPIVIPADKGEE